MEDSTTNTINTQRSNGLQPLDYFKITFFGFGLSAVYTGFTTLILPLLVLGLVPAAQKNTYLSVLTFAGMIVGMAIQPVAGAFSDRTNFRWGRRKPYILAGTLASIGFLIWSGYAETYVLILVAWCLLQASVSTAQGPFQAFIPDLVPEGRRGVASGVKVLMEVLGGVALLRLIGFFMERRLVGEGNLWLLVTMGTLAALLLITMLVTLLTVKEREYKTEPQSSVLASLHGGMVIDFTKDRPFMYFLISRLLFVMALTTVQTFGLFFLSDVVITGSQVGTSANVFVIIGVCTLLAVYPAGRLSDRVGRRPILHFSGFLGVTGILILYFLHTYAFVLFGGCLVGMAAGAFLSTSWALATDLIEEGQEARYLGLAAAATAAGTALSRIIGPGIDYFNALEAGMGYSFMLLACLVYIVAGTALLSKVKKAN
jgi:Na+/melibiose symporter-like transporter